MVGKPGEFYLSHVTPQDGAGKSIDEKIFGIIKDTPLEEKLKVWGSDETAVMTGSKKEWVTTFI